MALTREQQVTRALLSMADHLIAGDDAVHLLSELASTAVRLLEVTSCGVLLADDGGQLHVVAASSDAARTVEMLALQRDDGPCLDCFRSGSPVSVPDIAADAARWPAFAELARGVGFVSVHAFPLRLREHLLGVVGLFDTVPRTLTAEDAELAEALGHVAGIALVAQRVAADQQQLNTQLQHALDSRVVIEQCKGLIAASGDVDMDTAFRVLRKYARDHNLGLTAVARSVVERELPPDFLLAHVSR